MSGTSGEKTEMPTDKKLRDGREKGQVAKSQDIDKLFITAAGFNVLIAMVDTYLEKITKLIKQSIESINTDFTVSATILTKEALSTWLSIVLPVLGIVIVARFLAGFSQFGFIYAPKALKMDMQKFSPVSNGKNLVSKKKFVEFFGNVTKATVLALVVYSVVKGYLPEIVQTPFTNFSVSIELGVTVFAYILRISLAIFLVIAVVDFMIQKKIFIKSMKMTKDEVYREFKQSEGDPDVKAQRKELGRELASGDGGGMEQSVAESDAVVVNPSHFAVALRYKPGKTPLPIIKCKGVDARALQIIEYAEENEIPVIRYISLARALFHTGREGKFIPRPTLLPVASVFKALKEIEAEGGDVTLRREIREPL
ncbi:MAG: type III secretion system export apparatus subunit SctU [Acidiferrobacterales bacterium]|nr:type III secretion system export apparatus subunit SctU [Acidiferrobacterales bacterium]